MVSGSLASDWLSVTTLRWPALLVVLAVACRMHPPMYGARTIGQLRELNEALRRYAGDCGGYPEDLVKLTGEPGGAQSCGTMGLIPASLLAARRSGYEWSYRVGEAVPGRPALFKRYELRATWRGAPDALERRSFWTDETREIRSAEGRSAGPDDEPLR